MIGESEEIVTVCWFYWIGERTREGGKKGEDRKTAKDAFL